MDHSSSQKTTLRLPAFRWRGLTLQLFLFTVLPLTVLLLVISFGSLTLHHNSMRALVGDRDLRAVRAAANSLSHEIEHRAIALQLFAQQVGRTPNPETLLDATALPGFEGGLAMVSPDGQLIAGGIQGLPELVSYLPPPADNVVFSNPIRSQTGIWLVLASAPVPGGDRLVGGFSTLALARTALAGVSTPQTTILLLSSKGEVLYQFGEYDHNRPIEDHAGAQEVLRGESGVNYATVPADSSAGAHPGEHMFAGESEHLVAFAPVPPLGWGLILEESWEEIASPLLRLTQSAPLVLVPVLILAVLALWFGGQQIVRPLQALESRASRLASGDFAAIRAPVGGISEIRHLQGALVDMARDLQSAQESLHGYIGALTAGVENERRSLARELHDDTLQALIALNQHVQLALLRTTDSQQRQPLLDLQNRVGQTITNLRRAIGGLRPIYLEDLGLIAALGMLVKQVEDSAEKGLGAPIATLTITGPERRLPSETELAFYRITQEALNNAVHHAGAKKIHVELAFDSSNGSSFAEDDLNTVTLSIQDDGQGFSVPNDPVAFARWGHYGLLGMRERADLVGASLEIDSVPGRGTKIMVKCTLDWQTVATER